MIDSTPSEQMMDEEYEVEILLKEADMDITSDDKQRLGNAGDLHRLEMEAWAQIPQITGRGDLSVSLSNDDSGEPVAHLYLLPKTLTDTLNKVVEKVCRHNILQ